MDGGDTVDRKITSCTANCQSRKFRYRKRRASRAPHRASPSLCMCATHFLRRNRECFCPVRVSASFSCAREWVFHVKQPPGRYRAEERSTVYIRSARFQATASLPDLPLFQGERGDWKNFNSDPVCEIRWDWCKESIIEYDWVKTIVTRYICRKKGGEREREKVTGRKYNENTTGCRD